MYMYVCVRVLGRRAGVQHIHRRQRRGAIDGVADRQIQGHAHGGGRGRREVCVCVCVCACCVCACVCVCVCICSLASFTYVTIRAKPVHDTRTATWCVIAYVRV
jgi:hypothetical protein